jgi:glucosamine--fructose-6-phosphate aminotransferase (isomerizing)
MCGIVGIAKGLEKEKNCVEEAEEALSRLTYRGYDSWGFSTVEESNKKVGEFDADSGLSDSSMVAAHTRWATHGKVTEANSHPQTGCRDRFHIVHNGTIENFEELKNQLSKHTFTSDTDTEVIPHFVEHHVQAGRTPAEALNLFNEEAQGNYAVVMLDREEQKLYGLKQGSPLVFAFPRTDTEPIPHPKGAYFASDLYAISDKCEEAYFMEDGDLITTHGSNLALWENGEIQRGLKEENWKEFEWTEEEPVLGEYGYWMEKEIFEQPAALKRLEKHLDGNDNLTRIKEHVRDADKVIFTASGTSYHATLLAVYFLQREGVDAQTLIASEFENFERVTDDTVVIAVSQSGETRDVLDAVSVAREKDATIVSLVNVPHSTLQRESDLSLEIKAQQENCVAATKTFTNQVAALMKIADTDIGGQAEELEEKLPSLNQSALEKAEQLLDKDDLYIIGNASTYPIAREIALKVKEISYIHAEGMMAGELKHGTLALIEEGTPVLALDDGTGQIDASVKEVEARGGDVTRYEVEDLVVAASFGFLLAMHLAELKGLPVDRPRNLAKSVTVK